MPVGDKSCRVPLRRYVSTFTGRKFVREKAKEAAREVKRKSDDGWRARDWVREIKKVDNNALGAPSIL